MNKNHYLSQQPSGDLICQWHSDPGRAQIIARADESGRYSSWEVVRLLKEAYEAGIRHKQEQLRSALGIKETS
jgi:hypothetical protein